ncbi:MAG: efflux RND transporter periplasmic adaptor subunit [Cytophagales bacterium]
MRKIYSRLVSAILLLFCLSCSKLVKKEKPENSPLCLSDSLRRMISLCNVTKEPVLEIMKLTGKIDADESKMIKVYPLVGGYVEKVNIELGDYVEKGQILAVVRSIEAAEIEKDVIGDLSQLQIAEKNVQVAEDMYGSGLLSEKDYVQAKNEYKKTKAEYERSLEIFNIYSLDKNSRYVIKAPMSGFVVDKDINAGMQLRSDNQNHILKIANTTNVWVIANVYETDVNKIKMGSTVKIHVLAYPDREFVGKIDKLYDFIDPETKVLKARVNLENKELLLKPEMLANVNVHISKGDSLPSIPSDAIIFVNNKNYVITYKDKCNLEIREVNIVSNVNNRSFIMGGISTGEKIICKKQLLVFAALND